MSEQKTPPPEGMTGSLEETPGIKEVVRHIFQGCSRFQATSQGAAWPAQNEPTPPELSAAYDSILDRAEDFVRKLALLSPEEGARFQQALSLLRTGRGIVAVAEAMSVEGLGVYEALLTRSWAIRYDNPREMCHLANVATRVAEALDPEVYGPERIADLKARAWGELANALRATDRLLETGQAFAKAFSYSKQGSGDRRLLLRLWDLEASFLGSSREFSLASQRLTILHGMYKDAGETHLAGRALVIKALYLFYAGNTDEACLTLGEGIAQIDEERDPDLALVANINQLLFLVDSDRCREARRVLFKKRGTLNKQGRIAFFKLRWIEGRISYGLQELESAEIAFREARVGLADAGLMLTSALATLELAMTLMRQGRTEEAAQEGFASVATFLSQGVHREILGSAMFLEQALLNRDADVAFLESTARYLRKKMMELGIG